MLSLLLDQSWLLSKNDQSDTLPTTNIEFHISRNTLDVCRIIDWFIEVTSVNPKKMKFKSYEISSVVKCLEFMMAIKRQKRCIGFLSCTSQDEDKELIMKWGHRVFQKKFQTRIKNH